MVECHVCDGGKFSSTASLATLVRDCQKEHPGNNPRNKPLGWLVCQPTLVRGQTNRIMVLRGSFNPPHVGHLNLLTYAFDHSGQNIRAAIIMTSSDKSLNKKFADTDETIKFSKKERQKLWKRDVRLPQWAWVYEDSSEHLGALRGHLKRKARSGGYELEYVSLFGPDGIDLFEDNSMRDYDDRYRSSDFNQVLVCDVSREAGLPDQITELRTFVGFSPWKRLELNEQALEEEASAEAEKMLAILIVKAPEEYRRAMERGGESTSPSLALSALNADSKRPYHKKSYNYDHERQRARLDVSPNIQPRYPLAFRPCQSVSLPRIQKGYHKFHHAAGSHQSRRG